MIESKRVIIKNLKKQKGKNKNKILKNGHAPAKEAEQVLLESSLYVDYRDLVPVPPQNLVVERQQERFQCSVSTNLCSSNQISGFAGL